MAKAQISSHEERLKSKCRPASERSPRVHKLYVTPPFHQILVLSRTTMSLKDPIVEVLVPMFVEHNWLKPEQRLLLTLRQTLTI